MAKTSKLQSTQVVIKTAPVDYISLPAELPELIYKQLVTLDAVIRVSMTCKTARAHISALCEAWNRRLDEHLPTDLWWSRLTTEWPPAPLDESKTYYLLQSETPHERPGYCRSSSPIDFRINRLLRGVKLRRDDLRQSDDSICYKVMTDNVFVDRTKPTRKFVVTHVEARRFGDFIIIDVYHATIGYGQYLSLVGAILGLDTDDAKPECREWIL